MDEGWLPGQLHANSAALSTDSFLPQVGTWTLWSPLSMETGVGSVTPRVTLLEPWENTPILSCVLSALGEHSVTSQEALLHTAAISVIHPHHGCLLPCLTLPVPSSASRDHQLNTPPAPGPVSGSTFRAPQTKAASFKGPAQPRITSQVCFSTHQRKPRN